MLFEQDRIRFVECWEKIIGFPYIWAAENPALGFDCSGAVRYCWLHAGYRMDNDMNASAMCSDFWKDCRIAYAEANPGDLLFYGKTKTTISHVMCVFRKWGNGRLVLCGARGGDSTTNNMDIAYKQWALVDICADNYWKSNLQFVVNPFLKAGKEQATDKEVTQAKTEFLSKTGQLDNYSKVALEPDPQSILERVFPWMKRR